MPHVIVGFFKIPIPKIVRRTPDFDEIIGHIAITQDGTLWGLVAKSHKFHLGRPTLRRIDHDRFVRIKGLPFADETIDWQGATAREGFDDGGRS